MNDQQREALQTLAGQVRSNFKKLDEPQIIGRIMIISRAPFSRACKAYGMMVAESMFDKFVSRDGYGSIARMIEKNPALLEAFERLDLIPTGCEVMKWQGWERPKPFSVERLKPSLPDAEF